MRLNKDNCHAKCYDSLGEASLEAKTWDSSFPKARVIEVPKIWREYGKQYKVTDATISGGYGTALDGTSFIVKAPIGCNVNSPWAERIEYYD